MGKDSFASTTLSTTPTNNSTSSLANDERFYCGFITHVASATLLIGAVGSLASSIVLASLLKAGAEPENCFLAGIPLVMCLCGFFCAYPALNTFLSPKYEENIYEENTRKQLIIQVKKSLRMLELISSIFSILILGYFQSIVFRAHNWLQKMNKQEEQQIVYFNEQNI
uniref:Transmembrane protein n=1 Tax=Meloidogyne hapla TaxID=6305 RepID=A0A1I8BJE1_MELHA